MSEGLKRHSVMWVVVPAAATAPEAELEPVVVWPDVLLLVVSLAATALLVDEVEVLALPVEAPSEPLICEDDESLLATVPLVEVVLSAAALLEVESLLATDAPVEAVVLEEAVALVSELAKPLVLPVALSELLDEDDGELAAELLVDEVSLLATDELVDGEVLVEAVELVSLLATAAVLSVALKELVEDEEGEAAAELLLADVSLLATDELVDGEVLVAAVELVSELAKPLVLPVALSELLDEDDGELAAELLLDEVSLLAIAELVDGVVLAVALELVSLLARALVLPEALNELLEDEEGDAAAELLVDEVSLLAIDALVDGVALEFELEVAAGDEELATLTFVLLFEIEALFEAELELDAVVSFIPLVLVLPEEEVDGELVADVP